MFRQCKRYAGAKHAKEKEDCEGACLFLFVFFSLSLFSLGRVTAVLRTDHADCSVLTHLLLLLLLLTLILSSSGQASMFFTATRTLGCQTYLDSQKEACTCTLAEKAKKAIKDGATKVKQAAKAAGDAVKEAVHGAPAEGVSAEQQKHAAEQQPKPKKKKQPATQKPHRAQPQSPPIRHDKDEL